MGHYAGYYINLEQSSERRRLLEGHLDELGLRSVYQRFAAIDGRATPRANSVLKAGEIGCFASHLQLLELIAAGRRPAHVLEDDVVLSSWAHPVISDLVRQPDLSGYDLIFTDTFVPIDVKHFALYSKLFADKVEFDPLGHARHVRDFLFLNLRDVIFSCTSSYVVSTTGAARTRDLLRADFESGPACPVDLAIRRYLVQGKLRVTCLFPFVTGLRVGMAPVIEGRERSERTRQALELARNLFFLGADASVAEAQAAKALATPLDVRQRALLSLLQFAAFSRDFRGF